MKKILILMIVPAYMLLLAGFNCGHHTEVIEGESGKAFFWKNSDPEVVHHLYIDDVEKGILPFISDSITTPGNVEVQKEGLSLILKPGRYDIASKDTNGNIFCEGSLYLKRTESSKEVSSSWKNGKCKVELVYDN